MRTKVQMYGGGFGNGKTATMVIKGLELAKDYPGSTGLLARSTYPKLNDTLRKEFLKWCPPEWIKSFPLGQNGSNVCTLKNGSTIYFRYIAQQGKSAESTTSNLLSATYDWAGIDQIEDPEIMHKDFLDLFGRLRGSTPYAGDDPTMPKTGPRWIMLACNPTGNWVYTKVVRPLHMYQNMGIITDDLLCIRDVDRNPVLRIGPDGLERPQLLLGLVEGSTYELRHIHEADGGDFIQTQESLYQGQQRERYLLGKWAAYEGLVYAQYDSTVHQLRERDIEEYLAELRANGYEPKWREGYDFGQASPSCYGLSFTTPSGQVILCDGFYKAEYPVDDQAAHIVQIRNKWGVDAETHDLDPILADPSIWSRKGAANKGVQGQSIAQMFKDSKIKMRRGNNDIKNGIVKVQKYLLPARHLTHPITKAQNAPRFYVNLNLTWFNDEVTAYYWKQNSSGQRVDVPNDTNDHAMDMTKYLLSDAPDIGKFFTPPGQFVPAWMQWQEDETQEKSNRSHRYG
jgi:hypothetical protein